MTGDLRAQFEKKQHIASTGLLMEGDPAPDISFQPVTKGETMSLSDFRGQVVVLEFWATWCGPCQGPMAELQTHLKRNGWDSAMNVWVGSDGFHSKAVQAFHLKGIPNLYILDKDGKIVRAGDPRGIDIPKVIDGLLESK